MGVLTGYARRTASLSSGGGGGVVDTIYNASSSIDENTRTVSLFGNTSSQTLSILTAAGNIIAKYYGSGQVDLGTTSYYVKPNIYLDPAQVDQFTVYRGSSSFFGLNPRDYQLNLAASGGNRVDIETLYGRIKCTSSTGGLYMINASAIETIRLDVQSGQDGVMVLKSGSNSKIYLYAGYNNYFVDQTAFGTSSFAHSSAIVDVVSTTKGLGLPSMTTAQKNAIASPRAGLVVFDDDLNQISYYTGAAWVDL